MKDAVVVYGRSAVIRCHRPPLMFGVYIIFFDERILLHLLTTDTGTLSPSAAGQ